MPDELSRYYAPLKRGPNLHAGLELTRKSLAGGRRCGRWDAHSLPPVLSSVRAAPSAQGTARGPDASYSSLRQAFDDPPNDNCDWARAGLVRRLASKGLPTNSSIGTSRAYAVWKCRGCRPSGWKGTSIFSRPLGSNGEGYSPRSREIRMGSPP